MPVRTALRLALLIAVFSQVVLMGVYGLATGGCFCAIDGVSAPPSPVETAALRVLPAVLPLSAPADRLLARGAGHLTPLYEALYALSDGAGSWGELLVGCAINVLGWTTVLVGPLAAVGWIIDRVGVRRRAASAT